MTTSEAQEQRIDHAGLMRLYEQAQHDLAVSEQGRLRTVNDNRILSDINHDLTARAKAYREALEAAEEKFQRIQASTLDRMVIAMAGDGEEDARAALEAQG